MIQPYDRAAKEFAEHPLLTAEIPVEQDGVYNPPTATAVARFQKQKGMNANGVVDDATRQRLGMATDSPRQ